MKMFVTDRQKILRYTGILLLICCTFMLVTNLNYNIIETLAGGRLIPIYNVEVNEQKLSLTFDSAWGAEDIDLILNTLKKENVKATFFVLGTWAEKYPEVIKRMILEGHDVANHSYSHPHVATLSYEDTKNEIEKANTVIEKISEKENYLFRAPYGEYNDNVIRAATELGLYTIQWDVDSLDWKNPGKEAIIRRVVERSKNGSIILMHNGTEQTAQALPEIISKLKEKGFAFVPVSELIYKEGYTIDSTGKQIKK